MIKTHVVNDYQEYVSLNGHKYPDDLIIALKHNERVPQLINSLVEAMHIIEKRKRVKLSRKKIKQMTYDLTKSFLDQVKRFGDEKAMSDSERTRLVAQYESKKAIKDDEAKELVTELATDGVIEKTDRT